MKLLARQWWCTPLIQHSRGRGRRIAVKSEASLVHIESSRPAKDTMRDPASPPPKKRYLYVCMCMGALPASMPAQHLCVWCPRQSEKGTGSSGV